MRLHFIKDIKKSGSSCHPFEGTRLYVDTGSVDRTAITDAAEVTYSEKPSRANLSVRKGDVLFAKMQGTIKVLHIDDPLEKNVYSTGFYSFRDERLLPRFLRHFFLSPHFNIEKDRLSKGATMKAINDDGMSQISIPAFSLSRQREIAAVLDSIESQIDLSKRQILHLDEQVKSLFNEMFAADCSKEIPLKSVANVGSSKRVFTDEFVDEGIPFYRGSEIGQLSKGQEPNNPFRITREHYAQLICDKGKPLPGDILMPSICDKGQLWIVDDREFYYKDGRVLSISPNRTRVMPRFLCDQLKITLTKMFKEIATGATFAEYKIVTLKEIPVFVPDMPTQRRYCEQAEQIDKLRFNYQKQIDLLNELMEKKMEEYFGGEEDA